MYMNNIEVTRTSWKSKGVVKGSQGPQGPSPLDKEQGNLGDTGSTRTSSHPGILDVEDTLVTVLRV